MDLSFLDATQMFSGVITCLESEPFIRRSRPQLQASWTEPLQRSDAPPRRRWRALPAKIDGFIKIKTSKGRRALPSGGRGFGVVGVIYTLQRFLRKLRLRARLSELAVAADESGRIDAGAVPAPLRPRRHPHE